MASWVLLFLSSCSKFKNLDSTLMLVFYYFSVAPFQPSPILLLRVHLNGIGNGRYGFFHPFLTFFSLSRFSFYIDKDQRVMLARR